VIAALEPAVLERRTPPMLGKPDQPHGVPDDATERAHVLASALASAALQALLAPLVL
jgi:hypothetical protein